MPELPLAFFYCAVRKHKLGWAGVGGNEEKGPREGVGGEAARVRLPLGMASLLPCLTGAPFPEGPLRRAGNRRPTPDSVCSEVKGQQCHLRALANGLHSTAHFDQMVISPHKAALGRILRSMLISERPWLIGDFCPKLQREASVIAMPRIVYPRATETCF